MVLYLTLYARSCSCVSPASVCVPLRAADPDRRALVQQGAIVLVATDRLHAPLVDDGVRHDGVPTDALWTSVKIALLPCASRCVSGTMA